MRSKSGSVSAAGEAGAGPRRPAQAATAKGRGATKASRTEDVLSRFHEEARLGEAYDARCC